MRCALPHPFRPRARTSGPGACVDLRSSTGRRGADAGCETRSPQLWEALWTGCARHDSTGCGQRCGEIRDRGGQSRQIRGSACARARNDKNVITQARGGPWMAVHSRPTAMIRARSADQGFFHKIHSGYEHYCPLIPPAGQRMPWRPIRTRRARVITRSAAPRAVRCLPSSRARGSTPPGFLELQKAGSTEAPLRLPGLLRQMAQGTARR